MMTSIDPNPQFPARTLPEGFTCSLRAPTNPPAHILPTKAPTTAPHHDPGKGDELDDDLD